jgi:hypothetical protein
MSHLRTWFQQGYHRMADLRVSTTDPNATLMPTKDGTDMGYRTHYVVMEEGLASSSQRW